MSENRTSTPAHTGTIGFMSLLFLSVFTVSCTTAPRDSSHGFSQYSLAPIDSNAYTRMSQVWWMDDHRIIFNGRYPAAPKSRDEAEWGILIWDTKKNEISVFKSNKDFTSDEGWSLWCFYSKNQFVDYERKEQLKPKPFWEYKL